MKYKKIFISYQLFFDSKKKIIFCFVIDKPRKNLSLSITKQNEIILLIMHAQFVDVE